MLACSSWWGEIYISSVSVREKKTRVWYCERRCDAIDAALGGKEGRKEGGWLAGWLAGCMGEPESDSRIPIPRQDCAS